MNKIVCHFTRKTVAFVAALILANGIFGQEVLAQGAGDLIVTPTRVVLEGRDRAAQVTLSNQGSTAAVFRISLIAMDMDENGNLKEIEAGTGGVKTAEDLIRYAPRQIEIAPGATQVVRLSVRKPAGLEEGEYRSHMFFRAVPDESAGRNVADDGQLQDNELRVELIPIYGITIPVIVRHGELSADVGLSDVQVLAADADRPARISLNMTRAGDSSAFGDVTATYTPSGGGSVVVAQVTRVAVYTPRDSRRLVMPLRLPEGVTMGQGTLRVEYRATAKAGGHLLAESTVQLP
ncbi:MAG: fimbria/pilus periplasmic chaperone [Rhodospirillales bacterium]